MKILIIHGPNLNLLGKRDTKHYGLLTLDEINSRLATEALTRDITLSFFQSNYEGGLIDFLQKEAATSSGILINPGALTHYGYSLRDALADTNLPVVEVHISNIVKREPFRKINVLKGVSLKVVMGKKEKSYVEGLNILVTEIRKKI